MSKSKPIITAVEILERELRGLQEAYESNISERGTDEETEYTSERIKATMKNVAQAITILTEIQQ